MITLGIETATPNLSIALLENEKVLSCCEVNSGETHSVNIMMMIQFVLDKANKNKTEIDLIAVDHGPGSFTSLRIGLATARGLAQFGDYPVVSIGSLDIIKENINSSYLVNRDCYVIPMIDGKKKQVFASIYYKNEIIEENLDIKPLDLVNLLKEKNKLAVLLGTGAVEYKNFFMDELNEQVEFVSPYNNDAHAHCAALLGRGLYLKKGNQAYHYILPNYVRQSDAEILFNKS